MRIEVLYILGACLATEACSYAMERSEKSVIEGDTVLIKTAINSKNPLVYEPREHKECFLKHFHDVQETLKSISKVPHTIKTSITRTGTTVLRSPSPAITTRLLFIIAQSLSLAQHITDADAFLDRNTEPCCEISTTMYYGKM